MLARESVYWPRINDDIDIMTKACRVCHELQVANRKEPMIASGVPTKAWKVLATHIFKIKGRNYLILSDYFSKFPIVRELSGAVTAVAITDVIDDMCGMFDRPDPIRSDNGPQYASAHFTAFCKSWGIEHVTSTPNYAQSNGFAERQVRWVKPVIKKCLKTSESIPQAILQMRATPIDAKLPSQAELLLKGRVATCLPSHTYENRDDGVHDRLEERRAKITTSYNTRALLRLERTMNLLEGGKGGEERMGREGGEGTEGDWGERVGRGRGGERERGERGRVR